MYYRARDARGHEYITDRLDGLPQALRARTERIELRGSDNRSLELSPPPGECQQPVRVHGQSFALGLVSGVGLGLVVLIVLRQGLRLWLRILLVTLLFALVAGLYLGALRRVTGQSRGWFASPSALIDDARRTVEKANRRQRAEQQLFDEIGREAR